MFKLFKNERKEHFKARLHSIDVSIWDKEYLKHQARNIREDIRLSRDRSLEAADALKLEVEREHKPETKAILQAKLDEQLDNAKRYEAQIAMIDEQVEGRPYKAATPGDPEKGIAPTDADPGVQGINDTIASFVEMKKMMTTYLKKL